MQAARLCLATFALGASVAEAATWVYAYENATEADPVAQEETWTADACQNGREQSPINIDTSTVVPASILPSIDTFFDATPTFLKNTGHGFQLFETAPEEHALNETSGEVDAIGDTKGHSIFRGRKYNFYQVHWHTPSENTVDGKFFPLEAHFVHQLDDPALVGTLNELAVIGLLYDLGECNSFLDYFWSEFPEMKGTVPFEADSGVDVDLNAHLVEQLEEGYYHWWGSLTTPPCTEGVNWNLLRKHQTVCQRQVDEFKTALGATQDGIEFNNRVVQPLYGRVVTVSGTNVSNNGTLVESGGAKAGSGSKATNWVYAYEGAEEADRAAQEETWTDKACQKGQEQSPINVDTKTLVPSPTLPSIHTFFDATPTYLKNTGHGFQLFETAPNEHALNETSGEVDAIGDTKGHSIFRGRKYNFYQVHWHTPSENTVDGKSFPLEAHFVHQLDDPALVGTLNELAVIGLLYDLGECNTFLDHFWSEFPEVKGTVPFESDSGVDVDLNAHLAEQLPEGYYHWWGSLTTPPCTEGVNWNLLRKHQTVCQRQVDEIKDALANTQNGIEFNNRVVQSLYNRVVTVSGTTSSTEESLRTKKPDITV